jgi:hypothetical protein
VRGNSILVVSRWLAAQRIPMSSQADATKPCKQQKDFFLTFAFIRLLILLVHQTNSDCFVNNIILV